MGRTTKRAPRDDGEGGGGGERFMEAALREILVLLEKEGPLTVPEVPRTWPVTRLHVKFAVMELLARGLVEEDWPDRVAGRPTLRITDDGRAALARERRAAHAA